MGTSGPQPQASDRSGHRWTSTAGFRSQWAPLDLHRRLTIAVGTPGPQNMITKHYRNIITKYHHITSSQRHHQKYHHKISPPNIFTNTKYHHKTTSQNIITKCHLRDCQIECQIDFGENVRYNVKRYVRHYQLERQRECQIEVRENCRYNVKICQNK